MHQVIFFLNFFSQVPGACRKVVGAAARCGQNPVMCIAHHFSIHTCILHAVYMDRCLLLNHLEVSNAQHFPVLNQLCLTRGLSSIIFSNVNKHTGNTATDLTPELNGHISHTPSAWPIDQWDIK
jgi:hypothetical protein